MKWLSIALAGLTLSASLILSACASDQPPPQVMLPRPLYSTYGVDASPYAYGDPAPYGYGNPWSQPDAETAGYLGANRFSPRPGLICERSRYVCYDQNGVQDSETTQYLGSRDAWNRYRLYGGQQVYVPSPQ